MTDGWGGETALSPWESLMWRADDGDPRTRSSGVLLERLAAAPDRDRLRAEIGAVAARVPRLRERVATPPVPLVAPRWVADAGFDLDYHLDHVALPGDGSDTELMAQVDRIMARPLDRERPPWRMTLVTGLADGGAALALQEHHVLSDGQGLMQLIGLLHTTTPDAERRRGAPPVPRQTWARRASTLDVLSAGLADGIADTPRDLRAGLGSAWRAARATATDPVGTGRAVADYGSSLGRMVTPPAAERTMRSDERGYATLVHEVGLVDLKAAAKAAGGTLNDAYLAAVLGAFRRHHERAGGRAPERLPLAFPISTRTADDPDGGNHFAGVRLAAPLAEPDPRARIAEIGAFARTARTEPALGFLDVLAPAIGLLPGPALTALSATLTAATDVQASNFPGPPDPLWLAGARVTGLYPFGPRPGIAAMITLLTYHGTCCVGVTADPGVVTDKAAFAECLREGFAEVLALA